LTAIIIFTIVILNRPKGNDVPFGNITVTGTNMLPITPQTPPNTATLLNIKKQFGLVGFLIVYDRIHGYLFIISRNSNSAPFQKNMIGQNVIVTIRNADFNVTEPNVSNAVVKIFGNGYKTVIVDANDNTVQIKCPELEKIDPGNASGTISGVLEMAN